jgi:hypothetical protein
MDDLTARQHSATDRVLGLHGNALGLFEGIDVLARQVDPARFEIARAIALTIPCLPHSLADNAGALACLDLFGKRRLLARSSRQGARDFRS